MGWFLTRGNYRTRWRFVRDRARYPELRWLNRLDWMPFMALAAGCDGLGAWLHATAPALGTRGPQMLGGASSYRRSRSTTRRTRSTRWRTGSAAAGSRPPTAAATTSG